MYKKVIFATVLFAFIGIQIVTSLQCYACNSQNDCRSPSKQTCSNATANATSDALRGVHYNVLNVTGSTYFECVNVTWKYPNNNSAAVMTLGCAHPNVNACYLALRPQYSNQGWQRTCEKCSGNLCNRSPAGTFSSSMFTILTSVVGLMLVKAFA